MIEMITMRAIGPDRAVASMGAPGAAVVTGALAAPFTLSMSSMSFTVTAWHAAVRERQPVRQQCGPQGSSVSTAQPIVRTAASLAGKAEVQPRYVDIKDADLMRAGVVWGPDPWRPHPV